MNRSPLRAFLLIPFVLGCFGLSPRARAQCQDGCNTFNVTTFLGEDALVNNTDDGSANMAIGAFAFESNTTGLWNTATGTWALQMNNGDFNTANGVDALQSNTTGGLNTATGDSALVNNTTGNSNTATGAAALESNTTGFQNTANGLDALINNTTGSSNTANGFDALSSNTTGNTNTAEGNNALFNNTTGNSNIALGASAGIALTTGSNNIDIGNAGVAGESKRIRIGTAGTQTKTYIAGISGATVPTGVAVIVDSAGHLGTTTSSVHFKDAVKPMDNASEAILALRPVTFRYTKELDPEGIPQFGLVAEDVEKVNPDLVARDEKGKPYTVRYEAVNAMLLNEFLKEHRKVEQLEKDFESKIAEQQKQIDALKAELKEQKALIQKVSAQIEVTKPAPQVVNNNQ